MPATHRFPMEKYDLLPQQLLYEGTISQDQLFEPIDMDEQILAWTHTVDYIKKLEQGKWSRKEERESGFPWSEQLIMREKIIMYGTVQAALYALEDGIAFNIAGGTHHAFADKAEGFCLLNDLAIAANYLIRTQKSKKVLIIDLDVHQGNGTAFLFKNNPNVFTFSMHGKNNYPLRKEISDYDIELKDGTEDADYLKTLQEALPKIMNLHKPDFIFYQSGVDVLATDKLGKLKLSIEGCKNRDKIILDWAYNKGIPITAAMGGGYSKEIKHIIEAHAHLFREASAMEWKNVLD